MTARNAWLLFAFLALALTGCGDDPTPPATDDGGSPDAGPPGCGSGTTMCGDICADTNNSRTHCGACDSACASGQACIDGACETVCPSGQVECAGTCVDTGADARHCGACGVECDSGQACVEGACAASCPGSQTTCGGACVDTTSHPANCGACGTTCETGQVCSAGTCQASCGGGLTECDAACVSTDDDPTNCGACGTVCVAGTGAVGVCTSGTCIAACEPLAGDCNADRGSPAGDGCETPLATDPENCGACANTCAAANAVAGCAAGGCVIAACDAGFTDCDTTAANGCEIHTVDDELNCGACGTVCATGTECVAGTCAAPVGESCTDAVALTLGENTFAWSATRTDYFSTIACDTNGHALVGPDVVMSFTATQTGRYTLMFDKPAATRWAVRVSKAACGTLDPGIACFSDWGPMDGSFELAAGETAFIYLRDTVSGANTLSNPLNVDVVYTACTAAPPVRLDPANGSTTSVRAQDFTVSFEAPVVTNVGVVTITSSLGRTFTYDLATTPTEVTFDASSTVMTIVPEAVFASGEQLTLTWTGISGVVCGTTVTPLPAPPWQVTVGTPACGVTVPSTVTRVPAPDLIFAGEQYVTADQSPTGYVYFGGTTAMYRIPKAGGAVQDVELLAGLTSDQMGYDLVIAGQNIFSIESQAGGSFGHVFRISSDGGATWSVEDYARFPVAPGDDLRSATLHDGRLYLLTNGVIANPTQIWSVDATATTAPAEARLERTITGEATCSGIARDASFYYVACAGSERLLRVPVGSGPQELITTAFDLSTTRNALHGVDTTADGVFDALYVQTQYQEAGYVCAPQSASPFIDLFTRFGTENAHFGLGFDRAANTLWMWDDATNELVSVQ